MTLNVRYLSTLACATYCHVCLSHGEGVAPVLLDGYTNMYPLLNRFTNNLHLFACQTIIRWDRGWPSFILLAPVLTWSAGGIPFFLTGITRLFSIHRTNGYNYSYRFVAQQPLWEFPDSLSEHSTFLPVTTCLARPRKPN